MPELPEVEIQRRNLTRWWVGQTFRHVDVVDGRVFRHGEAQRLVEATVTAVERRGKFILTHLDADEQALCLVIHLRMTGKVVPLDGTRRGTRAVFEMEDGRRHAFVDMRRLGHLDLVTPDKVASLGVLGALGPEPWPRALDAAQLRARLGTSRRTIKVALMDQTVIAGVGNIVAAEALWRARVDPRVGAHRLESAALERIGRAIRAVCEEVIELEDGDEVAYLNDPASPDAPNPFSVYQQSVCPRCEGDVSRFKQGGRTTWWCSFCQS